MSEQEQEPVPSTLTRTQAAVHRSVWPGWIWAVPLAAAAILGWLAMRFFFAHGISATVMFDDAAGVGAQSTRVTYRGVNVGKVSSVSLSPDGRHAIVGLSLDRSVENYLRSGTRFWLQGASLADPSSLVAVISGPTIEMEPGPGKPQRHFIGLPQPPAFAEAVRGTQFTLRADARGSLRVGSGVYYLGLAVGKVMAVRLIPPHQFRFEVLVRAPYDRLVHPGSRFWDAGALELSFSSGLKLQMLSPAAFIEGALEFETPESAAAERPSPKGAVFRLYPDPQSAALATEGPHALYRVQFPGAVGALQIGAPVKLRDFVIGRVREVNLAYDARTGRLRTPVIIELDADRLHIEAAGQKPVQDWTNLLNRALARLVRQGLRARLDQNPQLIGAYYVALDFVPGVRASRLDLQTTPPQIPSVSGGGLGGFASQLGQLPIRAIAANVRDLSARINALVSSPEMTDSLHQLDRTLDALDHIVRGAQPQMKPLIVTLRRAAGELGNAAAAAQRTLGGPEQQNGLNVAIGELTRAARSVRVLADYLERHPEALIEGKRP